LKNKPLLIDLIGIWGAGKTTLVRNTARKLKRSGLNVSIYDDYVNQSRTTRYLKILLLTFKHPVAVTKMIFSLIKLFWILRPTSIFQWSIFKTFFRVNISKMVLLSSKPDVLFWEGDYHLITIFQNMPKLSTEYLIQMSRVFLKLETFSIPLFIDLDFEKAKHRVAKDLEENGIQRFAGEATESIDKLYNIVYDNQKYLRNIFYEKCISHASMIGENDPEACSSDLQELTIKLRRSFEN